MYGLQDPTAEIEYRRERVRSAYRRANPQRADRGVTHDHVRSFARSEHGLRRLRLAWPNR